MSKRDQYMKVNATQQAVSAQASLGRVEDGDTIKYLAAEQLRPDPKNPRDLGLNWENIYGIDCDDPRAARKRAAIIEIEKLAESLKQDGVMQPIRAYRHGTGFRIITGEQRWAAARLAGLTTVPVVVCDKPARIRRQQLSENFARTDLDLWTRLNSIRQAKAEHEEITGEKLDTGEKLAAHLSTFGERTARYYLALLDAPARLSNAISNGLVTKLRPAIALLELAEERREAALARLEAGASWEVVAKELQGQVPAAAEAAVEKEQEATPAAPAPKRQRGRPAAALKIKKIESLRVGRVIVDLLAKHYDFDYDAAAVQWNDKASVQRLLDQVIAAAEQKAKADG